MDYSQRGTLALVCRLWRDLSEEMRYRHLIARDVASIDRLKALVQLPASTRVQALSSNDRNRRARGVWTRTVTIASKGLGVFHNPATMPHALTQGTLRIAHVHHLEQALISLLRHLPNLRLFSMHHSDQAFMTTSNRLMLALPHSVTCMTWAGMGSDVSLRDIPKSLRQRLKVLKFDSTRQEDDLVSCDFPNLQWLSVSANYCGIFSWVVPRLSFLSLRFHRNLQEAIWERFFERLGVELVRLELHNKPDERSIYEPASARDMVVNSNFLRFCPKLETLVFDLFGWEFVQSQPPSEESVVFPSIVTLVLIIGENDCHEADGKDAKGGRSLRDGLESLWPWIEKCLTGLREINLSLPPEWEYRTETPEGLRDYVLTKNSNLAGSLALR